MSDTPIVTLSAHGVVPQLEQDAQGNYSLIFDLPGCRAAFALDGAQLRTLGLLCLHRFPDIEPRYSVPEEDEAFRLPARKILLFADAAIQVLMREIQSTDLIAFLWYMGDEEIAQRVLGNLTARAAEMMMDDLEKRYDHLDPNKLPQRYADEGRAATLKVVAAMDRLMKDGLIKSL